MKEYTPGTRHTPKYLEQTYPSAWGDIPTILLDIIKTYRITPNIVPI